MLKLTPFLKPGSPIVLKLEGKLTGPWIEELHRTIDGLADAEASIQLDLSALSYVDAAGTQALFELMDRGVVVAAASGFVATLLQRRNP